MNKRVIAVLVCTLVALVAATLWVPYVLERGRPDGEVARGLVPYGFALVGTEPTQPMGARAGARLVVHWPWLAGELALILLLGLRTALFFRTRAARGAAT